MGNICGTHTVTQGLRNLACNPENIFIGGIWNNICSLVYLKPKIKRNSKNLFFPWPGQKQFYPFLGPKIKYKRNFPNFLFWWLFFWWLFFEVKGRYLQIKKYILILKVYILYSNCFENENFAAPFSKIEKNEKHSTLLFRTFEECEPLRAQITKFAKLRAFNCNKTTTWQHFRDKLQHI